MPMFSIITPCYNSSNTIWDTFQSLLSQTADDFEWILVDDASTDNGLTRIIIEKIVAHATFPVKTFFLEKNYFGSKSVFIGCSIAEGKYVAVLDHDDQLAIGALHSAKEYIQSIGSMDFIAGVCGRCVNESGVLIGESFKVDYFLAAEGDVRFKLRVTSELFQFSKIDVAMPIFEMMKPGYTNGFVWAKISEKYKYLYVNEVFRIYNTNLSTSYSRNKMALVRFPEAKAEALKSTIFSYRPFLSYNYFYALRLLASYIRHLLNARQGFLNAIGDFDAKLKVAAFVVYPAAWLKSRNLI